MAVLKRMSSETPLRRSARTPHAPSPYVVSTNVKLAVERKGHGSSHKKQSGAEKRPKKETTQKEASSSKKMEPPAAVAAPKEQEPETTPATLSEVLSASLAEPSSSSLTAETEDFGDLLSTGTSTISGLSVREALSGRFTTYRSRTKRKHQEDEVENPYQQADYESRNLNMMQDILNNANYAAAAAGNDNLGFFSDFKLDAFNNDVGVITTYPFAPFYTFKYPVIKRFTGCFEVNSQKYVKMNTIIHYGSFSVPLDHPFSLLCEGYGLFHTNLYELFMANGIAINAPKQVRDIAGTFNASNFFVHHAIIDLLIAVQLDGPSAVKAKENLPIHVSETTPPFVCSHPDIITFMFGRHTGDNMFFDVNDSMQKNPTPDMAGAVQIAYEEASRMVSDAYIEGISLRDKLMLIVANDMGANLTPELVRSIIVNRHQIIREQTTVYVKMLKEHEARKIQAKIARGEAAWASGIPPPPEPKYKIRKSNTGALNMIMWKFFEDCMLTKTHINGKIVREFAMTIATMIGLRDFRGSEGWLDSFKRRHAIDLKQLVGMPVEYDEADAIALEASLQALESPETRVHDAYSDDEAVNETPQGLSALLASVEASTSVATASIHNTEPLDIARILGGFAGAARTRPPLDNEPISNLIRSCCVAVKDTEVSNAMDTIRNYILTKDPSAMDVFFQLQTRLIMMGAQVESKPEETTKPKEGQN